MGSAQLGFAAGRATSNHLFPFLITNVQEASVHIYTATTKQSSRTHVYSISCFTENRIRPSWSGAQPFVIWAPPPPLRRIMAHVGDWMHGAEDVSSVAAHRVITTNILPMLADRPTLSDSDGSDWLGWPFAAQNWVSRADLPA